MAMVVLFGLLTDEGTPYAPAISAGAYRAETELELARGVTTLSGLANGEADGTVRVSNSSSINRGRRIGRVESERRRPPKRTALWRRRNVVNIVVSLAAAAAAAAAWIPLENNLIRPGRDRKNVDG